MLPKLLAFDLDDTLLNSNHEISIENLTALKEIGSMGIDIILASGRLPSSMTPFARQIGLEYIGKYMICCNGALILDTETGSIVKEATIQPEISLKLIDAMEDFDLPIQYYGETTIYASRKNDFSVLDSKICNLSLSYLDNFKESITGPVIKFVIPGENDQLVKAENFIAQNLPTYLKTLRSKPFFIEALPAGADKGTALAFVAERMNLSSEEIWAVGDAPNDFGMIQFAGKGIAMDNAVPMLKEAANIVSSKNKDEHIAQWILRDLILSGVTN